MKKLAWIHWTKAKKGTNIKHWNEANYISQRGKEFKIN